MIFNLKLFKHKKRQSLNQAYIKHADPKDQKIINFRDAKQQVLAKEVIYLQQLINALAQQPIDNYKKTICFYIDIIGAQPISLKRLIKIIIHNPTITPIIEEFFLCLPYESRVSIIEHIYKTWPHHHHLIRRLKHLSYLYNFCERTFPKKSFLSIMPKHIMAQFILENEISFQ